MGRTPHYVGRLLRAAGVAPIPVHDGSKGAPEHAFRAEDLRLWVEGRRSEAVEPWDRLVGLLDAAEDV